MVHICLYLLRKPRSAIQLIQLETYAGLHRAAFLAVKGSLGESSSIPICSCGQPVRFIAKLRIISAEEPHLHKGLSAKPYEGSSAAVLKNSLPVPFGHSSTSPPIDLA